MLILLGVALGLTSWFVDAEIPTRLVEWMTTHVKSPALFLLMLNVVLLVLGSVLEIYSAIVVVAPLVAPLGVAYGIDPVHLGVVFLANLELGFLLPPMGLNLFLSAQRFGKPLPYVYRKSFPFLRHHVGGRAARDLPRAHHHRRGPAGEGLASRGSAPPAGAAGAATPRAARRSRR